MAIFAVGIIVWFGHGYVAIFAIMPISQLLRAASVNVVIDSSVGLVVQTGGIVLIIAGAVVFFVGRRE